MDKNKDIIIRMYFIEKLRPIDISKKLAISKSAVTQVLQKDNRYLKEKEIRKQINRKKNIEYTKQYITTTRKNKSIDVDYAILNKLTNRQVENCLVEENQ